MKKYLVILQDVVWNNLYYIGNFDTLEEAIPEINNNLPEELHITELNEYASTFGMAFDKEIHNEDDEDSDYYMVRGFILE
jgi:hypothetical protein